MALAAGGTYAFVVIDDRVGNLSFTLEEVGNAANAVSLTSQVTESTSTGNFVAFHNREGGNRTADLETVTIKSLAPGDEKFQIKELDLDLETGMFTLTWDSVEGEFYTIVYSTDLQTWLGDADDGIAAVVGEVTTSTTFERVDIFGVPADAPRIFFRVELD